jgi:hypothetical protein
MGWSVTRRDAVKALAAGVSGIALLARNVASAAVASRRELRTDLAPKFELSPDPVPQFMEPLGVADGSVEAAWDHRRDDWGGDVADISDLNSSQVMQTKQLALPLKLNHSFFKSAFVDFSNYGRCS